MAPTPREIVQRTLRFETPSRLPRHLWALPWAGTHHPEALARIRSRFPDDIGGPASPYRHSPRIQGDAHVVGRFTDDWGCTFDNIHDGVIGEIRTPILPDLADWRDVVRPPRETLPENFDEARDLVNRSCAASDRFLNAACCPRPWERYQFLRGTENALCDMADPDDDDVRGLLRRIHEFYLEELAFWVKTDVDAVFFMDDWGSQRQLLIAPPTWRELFKPLYRDYIDIAHAAGKFAFMHSDGHILAVIPDLVALGLDAVNSQLFCMDMARYAEVAKGKITLWGEIDRQHIIPAADPEAGRRAVREVARHFYDPRGGLIAQCEFGPGGNPDVVEAVFDEWARIGGA